MVKLEPLIIQKSRNLVKCKNKNNEFKKIKMVLLNYTYKKNSLINNHRKTQTY
jgi:hypothetical protein